MNSFVYTELSIFYLAINRIDTFPSMRLTSQLNIYIWSHDCCDNG